MGSASNLRGAESSGKRPEDQSQPEGESNSRADHNQSAVVEKVLKHIRLSKAKRTLQARLSLASFKASHGWQDFAFDDIEPHVLGLFGTSWGKKKQESIPHQPSAKHKQHSRCRAKAHPYYPHSDHVPEQTNDSYRDHSIRTQARSSTSASASSANNTSILVTPPQEKAHSIETDSDEARRHAETTDQTNGSRLCFTNQNINEDYCIDDDQATAAELMLFLASGTPSPDRRLNSNPNQYHHRHLGHHQIQNLSRA
ncbi:hypothetical protein BY996DRAFT_4577849 [Phakopsora pachyrhizi]|uniref:Expressed protein n=1 Tax=Phakopsora pachyrhizi TaxID=170000 RepID=A0AAV0BMV9_PHAPC|nr:hypothetical protein BY996DRAFT_4577849 [Phakopsora pachyrhizi]CAH7687320.1 expressed protein [Phakopsora pachyrhizi]